MSEIPEIQTLLRDRNHFNSFVYTPLEDAIREIRRRQDDFDLRERVPKIVGGDPPQPFGEGFFNAIAGRHLATPNYEIIRFLQIADAVEFRPIFFEYHDDKFVSSNEWKYSLGCLTFYHGPHDSGQGTKEKIRIVDFQKFDGKKISEVMTLWNEPLIDFHHSLFDHVGKAHKNAIFYDGTAWLRRKGGGVLNFYGSYLGLFLINGILFENYMLSKNEKRFTEEVFLPTFIDIYKRTGHKPLIVALEPTDLEGEGFWLYHPSVSESFVKDKFFSKIVNI